MLWCVMHEMLYILRTSVCDVILRGYHLANDDDVAHIQVNMKSLIELCYQYRHLILGILGPYVHLYMKLIIMLFLFKRTVARRTQNKYLNGWIKIRPKF